MRDEDAVGEGYPSRTQVQSNFATGAQAINCPQNDRKYNQNIVGVNFVRPRISIRRISTSQSAYNAQRSFVVEKPHSLCFENNVLTIKGVVQVVEVDEREGQFKLTNGALVVKGSGLNIAKLDKDQGIVLLEVKSLTSIAYKQSVGLKGLFR